MHVHGGLGCSEMLAMRRGGYIFWRACACALINIYIQRQFRTRVPYNGAGGRQEERKRRPRKATVKPVCQHHCSKRDVARHVAVWISVGRSAGRQSGAKERGWGEDSKGVSQSC